MGNIGVVSKLKIKEMRDTLTLEDLAQSYEFNKLLDSSSQAVLSYHNRSNKVKTIVTYNKNSELTACTDNTECLINLGHPIFSEAADGEGVVDIQESAKRIYGARFHEAGHNIYTCFSELHASINRFESGMVVKPESCTFDQEDAYRELCSYMNKENSPVRMLLCHIYKDLTNCIEDGRMESLLLANDTHFAGMTEGLSVFRAYHKMSSSRWDLNERDIPTFMNLCLLYAKYHYIGNYAGGFTEFDKSESVIDSMLLSTTAAEFSEGTIKLILNIWPKIKELIQENSSENDSQEDSSGEKAENQKSSSQKNSSENSSGKSEGSNQSGSESSESSGNSGGSSSEEAESSGESEELEKAIEEVVKEISERMNETTQNSQNDENESSEKENESEIAQSKKGEGESSGNNSSLDDVVKNVLNSLADDKARKADKEEKNEEIRNFARGKGFAKYTGTSVVEQEPDFNSTSICETEQMMGNAVKKASREIERHFETDMRTRMAKNKYNGRKFYANKLVNRDFRYFGDKGTKKDVPKMKVGVVIDESGSMSYDNRYVYARAGAIALYDIFENISQMDIAIYGHTTGYSGVTIFPYTDFGLKERYVKERLCNISARSGNIDVVPITCMAEKLLKEDAEIKLLFIITDGLPYSWVEGMTPEEELTKVANEYTRKGIEIVVAALGEDRKRIQQIYQNQRFLDISSPQDLPRELVQVIKRKL